LNRIVRAQIVTFSQNNRMVQDSSKDWDCKKIGAVLKSVAGCLIQLPPSEISYTEPTGQTSDHFNFG
jgi:hypothetical protein